MHTNRPVFYVGFGNVSKQSGSVDCGLFAIAYITDIAFGRDPSFHVYTQKEMSQHFFKCIEQKKIEPFPISRRRRALNLFSFVPVKVYYYCCRTEYYSNKMVGCDGVCGEWFHVQCIDSESPVGSEVVL